MIRLVLCGAAITAAVVGAPGVAMAAPAGETDVPNMQFNVAQGAPCSNWQRYIFGRTASGQAVACVNLDGQGRWAMSSPLRGVQQIGTPCGHSDAAAQSPDGRGLVCNGSQGWQPNSG